MSNWFSYQSPGNGQQGFADIDYKRVHGQPGVGFYRLIITISAVMHQTTKPEDPVLAISDIAGDLNMLIPSGGELLVARVAVGDRRNRMVGEWRNRPEDFTIEADLDNRRIIAIEAYRQGRDLPLKIKLYATAVDTKTGKRYPTEGDIQFVIAQSDWLRVLDNMQFRRTILLEVPVVEESKDTVLAEAAKHLKNASDQLARGYYPNTVAECRKALECIKSKLPAIRELPEDEKSRTKVQRIAYATDAVFKVTHLAHHADELASRTEWSPDDAHAMIIMTGALLRMVKAHSENSN